MDDPLTSQAIAELMCEIEKQTTTTGKQERKVNPLGGKPNKNFLGRTINSALNYNKRESERTHANCQQKLQEMDERYERRKYNSFYNKSKSKCRSRSLSKSRSRSRSKRRRRSSSSTSDSTHSRSRSRKRTKKKHKKNHKKQSKKPKKSKQRRRSTSRSRSRSSIREENEASLSNDQLAAPILPSPEIFMQHSNHMALAVAMAYGQSLYAQSAKKLSKETTSDGLSMSDIVKELMSDEDENEEDISKKQIESFSLPSSSDNDQQVLTINVESEDEEDESSRESFHQCKSSSGSCINLDDSTDDQESQKNDTSDLEIIESTPEQQSIPLVVEHKSELKIDTVDLTED